MYLDEEISEIINQNLQHKIHCREKYNCDNGFFQGFLAIPKARDSFYNVDRSVTQFLRKIHNYHIADEMRIFTSKSNLPLEDYLKVF